MSEPANLPLDPQVELPTPPPDLDRVVRSKSWLWLTLGLILVACGLAAYLFYIQPSTSLQTSSGTAANLPPTPVATTLSEFDPIESAAETLVYISDNDPDAYGGEEVWLINPHTQEQTQVLLDKVVMAYKHYGSPELYYTVTNDRGEYHVLNLETGKDTVYDLLDHTDPSVSVSISVNSINQISPDGKYLVFEAGFYTVCPSPSPFPSGFEGGFGPCGPEESLETPSGYYLYDFAKQKATHLGGLSRVTRWDLDQHKLYVVDSTSGSHTKVIDLVTKSVTIIDSTQHFGYFLYPLLASDQLVKFEGGTGDGGTSPFGKIFLLKTGELPGKTIDESPTWTDIQPFITSSPDDKTVLYRRSVNVDGIHHNSIYRYDLDSGEASRLSKDQPYLGYNIYVTWINDYTLVTSVDPIEKDLYNGYNQYLVKIDLKTGEETRLTTNSNIQRFNSQ